MALCPFYLSSAFCRTQKSPSLHDFCSDQNSEKVVEKYIGTAHDSESQCDGKINHDGFNRKQKRPLYFLLSSLRRTCKESRCYGSRVRIREFGFKCGENLHLSLLNYYTVFLGKG